MKYGLLGGTFDPPHVGHAHIATEAMQRLALDEVIWIPANKNPLKRGRQTDAKKRLHMCRLAIEGLDGMAVSDIETSRGGDSYLVDTLEELKLVMPGDYWFIIGVDALAHFDTWKKPERILQLCRLGVFARPGTDLTSTLSRLGTGLQEHIDLVESPSKAVSSSNIRDMAVRGEDFSHLVTASVHDYIKKNGLYQD
jgi:nicotinate-nucleotide adenylyltransferase